MKNLFLFILFILPFTGLATTFDAVVRTANNRAQIQEVQLHDLVDNASFDGKHFKIVLGKSDEAIKFSESKEILLKAATAYFHLSKARNYFINNLNSAYVKNMGKIVARIELINQFSELGHFANDKLDPQFNNALTVPAGKGYAGRVKPWDIEIWFRPKKRVHINDLNVNNLANQEFKGLMHNFRNQIHMQSLQRFLMGGIQALTTNSSGMDPFSTVNLVRTAGSSLIMEFGYQFIDPISKATSRKWYWLDTALVPEIIYHEYSHAALSDHLVLSHSTAVIEGMADFFAGQIAHSPQLAKHIKKHNTFNGKNAKRKQDYMLQFEMGEYANTDFVFGILWELKNILGQEQGENFVFELRKEVTTNSSIRNKLIEGMLKTCERSCQTPFVDRLKILKSLDSRGL